MQALQESARNSIENAVKTHFQAQFSKFQDQVHTLVDARTAPFRDQLEEHARIADE